MSIPIELYPEHDWHEHAQITGGYVRVHFLAPKRGSWRPWWLCWTRVPGLEQVLFFLMNSVPLDIRAWAIHTDCTVNVEGRGQFDLSRSNKGVTCVPHEERPDMIAMEQFEVPIGHTVTFHVLVDLLNEERTMPYGLLWNNCHGFAFKVGKLLRAPHTDSFSQFYRQLRIDFRWKYLNPMPPSI
jgi:hypothetical protein